MTMVRLIVTGKLEFQALGSFLGQIFPEIEIEIEQVESFTSCRVQAAVPSSASIPRVDDLARHLIAAIDPGRKKPNGKVPDFVVAIDDLELWNLDQPEVVVSAVRDAIRRQVLAAWPSSTARQEKCLERLMDHAAFHLFSPMAEAYFFTDLASLQGAGVTLQPQLVTDRDVEDFETGDSAYLSRYSELPLGVPNSPLFPKTQLWYAKHPKEYLKHLISSAADAPIYHETKQGVKAMNQLKPAAALAVANHCRFLRSLIHDLADALNVTVTSELSGNCHPATSAHTNQNRLLRNI